MCHLAGYEATPCGRAKRTPPYSHYLTPSFHCLNSDLGWSTTQTVWWLRTQLQSCRQGVLSWTTGDKCPKEGDTLGNWCAYVKPLGVDPYLQQVPYQQRVQCLTGFAAQTQTGYYGKGQQVQSSTVTSAITAIGQTIAMACNDNPTKVLGSERFIPAIQIMIDGYTKADPPTNK